MVKVRFDILPVGLENVRVGAWILHGAWQGTGGVIRRHARVSHHWGFVFIDTLQFFIELHTSNSKDGRQQGISAHVFEYLENSNTRLEPYARGLLFCTWYIDVRPSPHRSWSSLLLRLVTVVRRT